MTRRAPVAVAALAAVAVYVNSLRGEFVFDDSRAIVNNPDVRPETPIWNLFRNDFWGTPLSHTGSHKSYRPLCVLTFKLNYACCGPNPLGYHVINVALHSAVTAIYTALVDRLVYSGKGSTAWPSLIAGLLFAVHPVHSEAVAGVVGRADLLAALFFLLSLASYSAYLSSCNATCKGEQQWPSAAVVATGGASRLSRPFFSTAVYLLLCVVCTTAAMLSKETGITVVAVCLTWHLISSRVWSFGSVAKLIKGQSWCRRSSIGPAVLTLSALLLLLARAWLMDFVPPDFSPADNPAAYANSSLTRVLTFSYLPAAHAALLVWPATLSFDWSMDAVPLVDSLLDARLLTAVALYSGLVLLTVGSVVCARALDRSADTSPLYRAKARHPMTRRGTLSPGNRREGLSRRLEPACAKPGSGGRLLAHLRHTQAYLAGRSGNDADDDGGYHATSSAFEQDVDRWVDRRPSTSSADSQHGAIEDDSLSNSSSSSSSSYSSSCRGSDSSSDRGVGNNHCFMRYRSNEQAAPGQRLYSNDAGHNAVLLALALLVFPFLPASNLFFYVGFVLAERVLYIPSMGYCLLVAHGAVVLIGWAQKPHCHFTSSGKVNNVGRISLLMRGSRLWRLAVVACLATTLTALTARTLLRNEDWSSEERLYRSGTGVNPAKAWANLANVLKARGDLGAAEGAYQTALRYRSNMADVHYNYGILLQDQKRFAEAATAYQKAISFRPQLTSAYLNLGILKAFHGSTAEAEMLYRRCADIDTSGLKDPRLHESTKVSCLYNLGRLHVEHGQYSRAIEILLEAVARRPDHHPQHSLFNLLGEAYFNNGELEKAEHWYQEALRAKPDHAPAHLTMARLLAKKEQNTEAAQWFKQAVDLKPADVNILQQYANFLLETGKGSASEPYWHKAAELAPDSFDVLMNTGNAMRRLGRNDAAERVFETAVARFPKMAAGHANLGAMLHLSGKYQEAERSYREALQLNPDDSVTQGNLKKLHNLRSVSSASSTLDR